MKLWYKSKTVWVNIISILIYLITSITTNFQLSGTAAALFGTALGLLNLILRIYFTNTTIGDTTTTTTTSAPEQLLKS